MIQLKRTSWGKWKSSQMPFPILFLSFFYLQSHCMAQSRILFNNLHKFSSCSPNNSWNAILVSLSTICGLLITLHASIHYFHRFLTTFNRIFTFSVAWLRTRWFLPCLNFVIFQFTLRKIVASIIRPPLKPLITFWWSRSCSVHEKNFKRKNLNFASKARSRERFTSPLFRRRFVLEVHLIQVFGQNVALCISIQASFHECFGSLFKHSLHI